MSREEIPIAHGELMTLSQFCQKLGIPLSEAERLLREKGVKFTPTQTLKEIGKNNGLSPLQIYKIIKPARSTASAGENGQPPLLQPGSGAGFMTIPQFCQKFGCDPQLAFQYLKKRGIEATPTDTIRQLARSHNLYPYQLAVDILKNCRRSSQPSR